MPLSHPIQRRYLAEDLIRLRRADERARYAASQRQGRIDPNPHQIDAVIFALKRIPEGGCILADEVGLGKTIEAGLVMAQLQAEGARRILVVLPKALVGQWQHELYDLFGIEASSQIDGASDLAGAGVFLIGREFAGGSRGSDLLAGAEPFDLVIIDEAHEIFAGIYRRYDREGLYQEESDQAIMAHRVRQAVGKTPVLLLTATPIQNSLTELWGLVQYVEPTGTLLGDLPTFRDVFCDSDDRSVVSGQARELRDRIDLVLQRTLRRQAEDFLEKPFVKRTCQRLDYGMTPDERALYDDVTSWLLEPELIAFSGRQRRLLLIGFHRRMASSLSALAASLERVAERLRGLLSGEGDDAAGEARQFAEDLEDDDLADQIGSAADTDDTPAWGSNAIRAELARVEGFIARCAALGTDSKAQRLLDALRQVEERAKRGFSGKAVLFTESLSTQDYLVGLLVENGYDRSDITVFRGQNDSAEARRALERWRREVGDSIPAYRQPSHSVAVRLALVHEFETRSRLFISTEAGAKGLNLQFCSTVINYDLPWNPQRIEQRIGRCHRYSQTHDVTVVNFVNSDNETEIHAFDILSQKLNLFGTVLDASDNVLYEARETAPEMLAGALGSDLQREREKVYERARSIDERDRLMAELNERFQARQAAFEEQVAKTARLIQTQFDEEVQKKFRNIRSDLDEGLAELDRDLRRLLRYYLQARQVDYRVLDAHGDTDGDLPGASDGPVVFEITASEHLPDGLREGGRFVVGDAKQLEDADPVHLAHPLVRAAIDEAREATRERAWVRVELGGGVVESLRAVAGKRGRLVLTRVDYAGFEPTERLLATALVEGDEAPLPEPTAKNLLTMSLESVEPFELDLDDDTVEAAVDEMLFIDRFEVEARDQERFDEALGQIERFVDDRALVLGRRLSDLTERVEQAAQKRDSALGAERRAQLDESVKRLERDREELAERLVLLETRQDEAYLRRRQQLEERRYDSPTVSRVLDVAFVLSEPSRADGS